MNCEKCGKSFQDDAVFCPYCGKNLRKFPRKSRYMKRGNGTGSVFYNRKTKTWTAQVTVGSKRTDPEKQRQSIRKTKTGFRTRSEALDYLPTLKAAGASVRPQIPSLEHYWEIYSSGEMGALGDSKKASYRIAWNRLSSLHHLPVNSISVADLRQVIADKCDSYYTAKDCKILLSALFRLAAADGMANKELPSFIVLPKLDEKERETFTDIEQANIWELYESGDIRAALPLLMIYTGMMPGEAMVLSVDNIDLENRTITGIGMKTKVRKKTPIVLAETILPVVQDLIDHANKRNQFWPSHKKEFYEYYYAALSAAGTRLLSAYSCRHTTATALAISEGIAPQTIQKVMRWSSSRMLDRYAHPDQSDALDAVDTIKKRTAE